MIEAWLGHQRRDDYWRHGSVCEDYGAIEAAVYAVGGWADGYSNAVPRLVAGLPGPRKGLIGPWSHAFPQDGEPGPPIGFLQECLRWWDQLAQGGRHRHRGRAHAARLGAGPVPPADPLRRAPGRWVAEPEWPSHSIDAHAQLGLPRSRCPLEHRSVESTGARRRRLVRRRRRRATGRRTSARRTPAR